MNTGEPSSTGGVDGDDAGPRVWAPHAGRVQQSG